MCKEWGLKISGESVLAHWLRQQHMQNLMKNATKRRRFYSPKVYKDTLSNRAVIPMIGYEG
ncbi:hypothetical protein O9993_18495 [Vibrio lentus]|nr:hypothetical protein [Vibrio lentus]